MFAAKGISGQSMLLLLLAIAAETLVEVAYMITQASQDVLKNP